MTRSMRFCLPKTTAAIRSEEVPISASGTTPRNSSGSRKVWAVACNASETRSAPNAVTRVATMRTVRDLERLQEAWWAPSSSAPEKTLDQVGSIKQQQDHRDCQAKLLFADGQRALELRSRSSSQVEDRGQKQRDHHQHEHAGQQSGALALESLPLETQAAGQHGETQAEQASTDD